MDEFKRLLDKELRKSGLEDTFSKGTPVILLNGKAYTFIEFTKRFNNMIRKEDMTCIDESTPFTGEQQQFLEQRLSDKKSSELFRKEYLCKFPKINDDESFMRKEYVE